MRLFQSLLGAVVVATALFLNASSIDAAEKSVASVNAEAIAFFHRLNGDKNYHPEIRGAERRQLAVLKRNDAGDIVFSPLQRLFLTATQLQLQPATEKQNDSGRFSDLLFSCFTGPGLHNALERLEHGTTEGKSFTSTFVENRLRQALWDELGLSEDDRETYDRAAKSFTRDDVAKIVAQSVFASRKTCPSSIVVAKTIGSGIGFLFSGILPRTGFSFPAENLLGAFLISQIQKTSKGKAGQKLDEILSWWNNGDGRWNRGSEILREHVTQDDADKITDILRFLEEKSNEGAKICDDLDDWFMENLFLDGLEQLQYKPGEFPGFIFPKIMLANLKMGLGAAGSFLMTSASSIFDTASLATRSVKDMFVTYYNDGSPKEVASKAFDAAIELSKRIIAKKIMGKIGKVVNKAFPKAGKALEEIMKQAEGTIAELISGFFENKFEDLIRSGVDHLDDFLNAGENIRDFLFGPDSDRNIAKLYGRIEKDNRQDFGNNSAADRSPASKNNSMERLSSTDDSQPNPTPSSTNGRPKRKGLFNVGPMLAE